MQNKVEFNSFRQEYLTIVVPNPKNHDKMIDVRLNKPTEKVKILITSSTIMQLELIRKTQEGTITNEESLEYIQLVEDLVEAILNNNRDGIKFDKSYRDTFFGDLENISTLIEAMTEFMNKVFKRKN